MTERETVKRSTHLVCDSCGYYLGWAKPRITMEVQDLDTQGYMRTTTLHFHLDPPVDPSWPRPGDRGWDPKKHIHRDCLAYWWGGRYARAKKAP